jgi:hypothetical protein
VALRPPHVCPRDVGRRAHLSRAPGEAAVIRPPPTGRSYKREASKKEPPRRSLQEEAYKEEAYEEKSTREKPTRRSLRGADLRGEAYEEFATTDMTSA